MNRQDNHCYNFTLYTEFKSGAPTPDKELYCFDSDGMWKANDGVYIVSQ